MRLCVAGRAGGGGAQARGSIYPSSIESSPKKMTPPSEQPAAVSASMASCSHAAPSAPTRKIDHEKEAGASPPVLRVVKLMAKLKLLKSSLAHG